MKAFDIFSSDVPIMLIVSSLCKVQKQWRCSERFPPSSSLSETISEKIIAVDKPPELSYCASMLRKADQVFCAFATS